MLMILVINSSYCQYPIIKKIGDDSVVIITIKQGEQVNKQFEINNLKIDSLKDLIKIKKSVVDSLNIEISDLNLKKENYKTRYEERLKMPTKYQYHDDGWDFAQKLILIGVIVLQFFTIKR